MCQELLQEGDQLNSLILIGFAQVDVLKIDNKPGTVFRLQNVALGTSASGADLLQFLDDVVGGGLCVAVDGRDGHLVLGLAQVDYGCAHQETLAAAFRAYDEQGLQLGEPGL